MKLEDQVTCLELSRKLRELDIKQGYTMFYWDDSKDTPRLLYYKEIKEMHEKFQGAICDYYSAFTASELFQILPNCVATSENDPFNNYRLAIWKFLHIENPLELRMVYNCAINYECDTHLATDNAWDRKYLIKNIWDKNPANAFAKMLIYLIEQKLIEV